MVNQIFSKIEIRDILISLLVLSLVFSYPEIFYKPTFFLVSLFVVTLAFVCHELMHKLVAKKLGYWAEYRAWSQGLILALLLTIITGGRIIFAAPGAVYFSSYWIFKQPNIKSIGKIGLAGPLINIIFLYSFILIFSLTQIPILKYIALINGWLAIFNLFPIRPLDGSKVFAWDWKIWLSVFVVSWLGFIFVNFLQ